MRKKENLWINGTAIVVVTFPTEQSWAKRQKPAKKLLQKIREINWLYLCLQQFNKLWIWRKCNDRKRKRFKSVDKSLQNFEHRCKWTYFRRVLVIWNGTTVRRLLRNANLLKVQVENMLSSPKEPTFTLHNTLGPYGLKYIDHKMKTIFILALYKNLIYGEPLWNGSPMKCL